MSSVAGQRLLAALEAIVEEIQPDKTWALARQRLVDCLIPEYFEADREYNKYILRDTAAGQE
ncbi:hypothetical protein LCGC14_1546400 [marine sediment metagenome]|uniref:Uncharacterized protein n=1 Tax=marine sediment metagenome TaxID=412755 RepID=A0A0F9JCF9_9ZZZZ